jgi:hypothetical protein
MKWTLRRCGRVIVVERASRSCGGLRKLAQQPTHPGVAPADAPALALARAFVVARADAHPRGQPLGAAEAGHVRPNLHQQHGCPLQVDARNGLQQPQLRLVGLQPLQQILIQPRDALLELLDVLHDLFGHEAVHVTELLGAQGLEQRLSTGPQPALAVQHLVHGLVRDERVDHGARARAVEVGHHHVDAHARVHQHLEQPVLLGAAHAH